MQLRGRIIATLEKNKQEIVGHVYEKKPLSSGTNQILFGTHKCRRKGKCNKNLFLQKTKDRQSTNINRWEERDMNKKRLQKTKPRLTNKRNGKSSSTHHKMNT